ncbi:unnamed protein product [Prorocentrum cordatum]|uniref:Uncharacterized protein n=1 Tax=Prorocentrum cordatum TaxID=2364126 RepID=A0ABN9Y2C7_9DINO|nr:unnamed protein product [Polarella glacialis]
MRPPMGSSARGLLARAPPRRLGSGPACSRARRGCVSGSSHLAAGGGARRAMVAGRGLFETALAGASPMGAKAFPAKGAAASALLGGGEAHHAQPGSFAAFLPDPRGTSRRRPWAPAAQRAPPPTPWASPGRAAGGGARNPRWPRPSGRRKTRRPWTKTTEDRCALRFGVVKRCDIGQKHNQTRKSKKTRCLDLSVVCTK